jgi:hypothetical protein
MKIQTPLNGAYDGHLVGHMLLDNIPAKVYFVDIRGREISSNYEWALSDISTSLVCEGIEQCIGQEDLGIPHIAIAFPHVTSLFRWGNPSRANERETNLYHVGSGKTRDEAKLSLNPPHPPYEACCPLEGMILGKEMAFWAQAGSVDEYTNLWVPGDQAIQVSDPNKLRRYLENN